MSQQMGRLAGGGSDRYETELEQANRKSSSADDDQEYENPVHAITTTSPQSLPATDNETAHDSSGFTKWQTVIWREWSRCEDDGYAYYLFDLIKNTTFGWKFIVAVAILGTIIGALMGYAIGSIMASGGLYLGPLNLTAFPPAILGFLMAITGGLIGVEGSRRFRSLYFWWQGQPSASLVEKALHQAITHRPEAAKIWTESLDRLEQQKKYPPQPKRLIDALADSNWQDRFVAQKTLVAIGGEAIPALQEIAKGETSSLQKMGIWLLSCIEQETANKFAWRTDHTLCPHCLTRFEARQIEVRVGVFFTWYGCRVCGQSQEYLYLPQDVVAVLDTSADKLIAQKQGQLRVNWSLKRALFDFDWVVIAHATDEDVERFAVQVGNDTDPLRQPRYHHMQCVITPSCHLSENTLRVLRHTFGQVGYAKSKRA